MSDLTGPRFEPQTSRSRDERFTARPTGQFFFVFFNYYCIFYLIIRLVDYFDLESEF